MNLSIISKQLIHLITLTKTPKKILEKILRDIIIQLLETKYVINLGQLLRIVLDIKWYIFQLVKYIQLVQLELVHLKPTRAVVAINH